MRISDWSSDVCSSDLHAPAEGDAVVGEIADISIEIEGAVRRREARDAETRQRGQQGVAVARVGRNADGHLVVGLKGCDGGDLRQGWRRDLQADRKSTRLNSSH